MPSSPADVPSVASDVRTSGPVPVLEGLNPPQIPTRVRRRYHFGWGGVVYMLITLLVALGAFNSQNNLLFWAFGFALAILIVSGIISGGMLMALRVDRELALPVQQGHTGSILYNVRKLNRFQPAFALHIEEIGLAGDLDTSMRRPSIFTRLFRSKRPPQQPSAVAPPFAFVTHVGARQSLQATGHFRALKRGVVPLSGILIHTSFPFGLLRKSVSVPQPGRLIITPAPIPCDTRDLLAGSRLGLAGSSSRRVGPGDEFLALREFVDGDALRDVAWKASARRGTLLVRQFAAPTPRRLWIVLRLRATLGSEAFDERAIGMAAFLARHAVEQGLEVGLAVPLNRTILHPRSSEQQVQAVLNTLAEIDLGADDARGTSMHMPPATLIRGVRSIIIHGGPVDHGFAPSGNSVRHVSSHDEAQQTETIR